MRGIEKTHGINPYIFAVLYAGGILPFWLCIYKLAKNFKEGRIDEAIKWALIFGFVIIVPFLYVALFGKNLPSWFWFTVAGILLLSVFSVVRKIKKKITT